MKTHRAEAKKRKNGKPLEVIKVGSVSVPIYRHTNIVPQRSAAGKIIYGPPRADGKPQALVKYQSAIAIAAFCGLRSAEIARLDWSEVHLRTGFFTRNEKPRPFSNGSTVAMTSSTGYRTVASQ